MLNFSHYQHVYILKYHLHGAQVAVLLHGDVLQGEVLHGEVLLPAHLVQQQQLILQLVQHDLENVTKIW